MLSLKYFWNIECYPQSQIYDVMYLACISIYGSSESGGDHIWSCIKITMETQSKVRKCSVALKRSKYIDNLAVEYMQNKTRKCSVILQKSKYIDNLAVEYMSSMRAGPITEDVNIIAFEIFFCRYKYHVRVSFTNRYSRVAATYL